MPNQIDAIRGETGYGNSIELVKEQTTNHQTNWWMLLIDKRKEKDPVKTLVNGESSIRVYGKWSRKAPKWYEDDPGRETSMPNWLRERVDEVLLPAATEKLSALALQIVVLDEGVVWFLGRMQRSSVLDLKKNGEDDEESIF